MVMGRWFFVLGLIYSALFGADVQMDSGMILTVSLPVSDITHGCLVPLSTLRPLSRLEKLSGCMVSKNSFGMLTVALAGSTSTCDGSAAGGMR